ncbi:hypothetical protein [Ochrobactrum sp. RH2CCR150]|uniref:hypothetical protein n=1 Tax=Ochrobactrum sp. RH2CCR150 TaxID=2587044 RepID=UPI0015F830D5|nr:hypothetical protein [Ochrobactrum sp. RH2CCR150]
MGVDHLAFHPAQPAGGRFDNRAPDLHIDTIIVMQLVQYKLGTKCGGSVRSRETRFGESFFG